MEKVFQGQSALPELARSIGRHGRSLVFVFWWAVEKVLWFFYVKTMCCVLFSAADFFCPVDNLDTLIKFIYMYVFGASSLTTIPVFRGLPGRDTY